MILRADKNWIKYKVISTKLCCIYLFIIWISKCFVQLVVQLDKFDKYTSKHVSDMLDGLHRQRSHQWAAMQQRCSCSSWQLSMQLCWMPKLWQRKQLLHRHQRCISLQFHLHFMTHCFFSDSCRHMFPWWQFRGILLFAFAVRFSFFSTRDRLGRTSQKSLCCVGWDLKPCLSLTNYFLLLLHMLL